MGKIFPCIVLAVNEGNPIKINDYKLRQDKVQVLGDKSRMKLEAVPKETWIEPRISHSLGEAWVFFAAIFRI